MWGCGGDSPQRGGFVYQIGERITRRCPISQFKPRHVQEALRLFTFFEQGQTPNNSGMQEETELYNEAMFACVQFKNAAASWDAKKHDEKLAKQKGRK